MLAIFLSILLHKKYKTVATSFESIMRFSSLYVGGRHTVKRTANRLLEYPVRPAPSWLLCLQHFSLWATGSTANQRWAGRDVAHTANCLVADFYYYGQTRSVCSQVLDRGRRNTEDGKCAINAAGKVCTGNKRFLVFNSPQQCKHKSEIVPEDWAKCWLDIVLVVTLLNWNWQH